MSSKYHHGNLKEALIEGAAQLLATDGISNFSLRKVARMAGVSHSAPANYFENSNALLDEVARVGFETLTSNLKNAQNLKGTAEEKLIQGGIAYLETATENPGHFAMMMAHTDGIEPSEQRMQAGQAAYEELVKMVAAAIAESGSSADLHTSATMAWATVHGLATLGDKVLVNCDEPHSLETVARRTLEAMARGITQSEL